MTDASTCRRTRTSWMAPALAVAIMILVVVPVLAASPRWTVQGGDAHRGKQLITHYGCGGCHTIPGIDGASGNVGPPLTRIGSRIYVAGVLRNTPSNLIHWIRDPQAVVPGADMPDMGIDEADARDIAAYLYTLQ